MEISKTTIGIAAGVAGTLFLGYCIYFDHKRRKDPDFKKKLRESEYSDDGSRVGATEMEIARKIVALSNVWNFLFFMVHFDPDDDWCVVPIRCGQGGKQRRLLLQLEGQGQPCPTWQTTKKCKGE